MPADFGEDVVACAEGGFSALEVWLTKLEQHLERSSVDDIRRLLNEKNLRLAAAAYQGGLLLSQGEARRAHFDHFKRRLEICEAFSIPTMLLVADFRQRPQEVDLERAVVSLAEAGRWAAGFNVALALEFRAADAFCTCLETAVRLTQACGEPNVGVCLDLFHFHVGPSKPRDLDMLTKSNLFHVQVCDLFGVARELASDADRILPGDGDLPLADVMQKLRALGYDRYVSLELMNPQLWQVPPKQLTSLSWEAMNRLLN
jgi:sugar phosphate isomerase/epimerase